MRPHRAIALALAAAAWLGCDPAQTGAGGDAADDAGDLPPLYQKVTILKFDLLAPFSTINSFIGDFQELDGTLRIAGRDIPIKIESRGASSKFECSFRKLEIAFPEEPGPDGVSPRDLTKGTAFEGVPSFKVGTHCAPQSIVIGEELEEGSLTRLGRLVSDRAPYREKFLYEIHRAITPFSHLTRRASIRYHDTTSGKPVAMFTKPALIVERFKHLRKRHDAVEILPDMIKTRDDVDSRELALDFLYQILILNTDWQVGDLVLTGDAEVGDAGLAGSRALWNHHAMELPADGAEPALRVAVPNDFDIALLGTLWPDRVLPPEQVDSFHIEDFGDEYERRLEFFRSLFSEEEQAFAVDRMLGARTKILGLLDVARLDAGGEELIREAIEAFFVAIDA